MWNLFIWRCNNLSVQIVTYVNQRKRLKNLKKVEGAVTSLLQVVAEKQVRSCSECIDGRVILSNSFFTLYSTGPIWSKTICSNPNEEHLQGMLGGESECFDWTVTISWRWQTCTLEWGWQGIGEITLDQSLVFCVLCSVSSVKCQVSSI